MFTKSMINKITKPIPKNLINYRKMGGKELSYISGASVIDILNDVFDYMWSWEITNQWIEEGVAKGEGGFVAHVEGVLTLHLRDENNQIFNVKKMASGSKVIIGGINQQDSIFKSAATDALKKAASLVGIGLELWRSEEELDWFYENKLNNQFKSTWCDETRKQYEEDLSKLNDYSGMIGPENVSKMLSRYSNGQYNDLREITPNIISGFIDFMREQESKGGDR